MRQNQPKHRQMRKEQRKLARQRASREGLPAVLIVCEGRETEPNSRRQAQKALSNSYRQKTCVQVVANSPSIEFWLLLHFEYSAREFRNSHEAERELQGHLTDYVKNDRDIFRKVQSGLDAACDRTKKLKQELRAAGALGPDTDFPDLIAQLRRMSQMS